MNLNKPLKRVPELQTLSHDHHHGLQLCWKIRTAFSKNIDPDRVKKYTEWFFKNHLIPHFELEEKLVFPILDPENKLIKQAVEEHKRLSILFNETSDIKKSIELIEKELNAHIRFEERVLFPEIQSVATEAQLIEIKKAHTEEQFVEKNDDPFWE